MGLWPVRHIRGTSAGGKWYGLEAHTNIATTNVLFVNATGTEAYFAFEKFSATFAQFTTFHHAAT